MTLFLKLNFKLNENMKLLICIKLFIALNFKYSFNFNSILPISCLALFGAWFDLVFVLVWDFRNAYHAELLLKLDALNYFL